MLTWPQKSWSQRQYPIIVHMYNGQRWWGLQSKQQIPENPYILPSNSNEHTNLKRNLHETVFSFHFLNIVEERWPQVFPKLWVKKILPQENITLLIINHNRRFNFKLPHHSKKHLKLNAELVRLRNHLKIDSKSCEKWGRVIIVLSGIVFLAGWNITVC